MVSGWVNVIGVFYYPKVSFDVKKNVTVIVHNPTRKISVTFRISLASPLHEASTLSCCAFVWYYSFLFTSDYGVFHHLGCFLVAIVGYYFYEFRFIVRMVPFIFCLLKWRRNIYHTFPITVVPISRPNNDIIIRKLGTYSSYSFSYGIMTYTILLQFRR